MNDIKPSGKLYSPILLLVLFISLIGLTLFISWNNYQDYSVSSSNEDLQSLIYSGGQFLLLLMIGIYSLIRLKNAQKINDLVNEDLNEKNNTLEIHRNQLVLQNKNLSNLISSKEDNFLHQITETATQLLAINSSGVWEFVQDNDVLNCLDFYDTKENKHKEGFIFLKEKTPTFLEVLLTGEVISAKDIFEHEYLKEIQYHYSGAGKSKSLLITPITFKDKILGVCWFEHKDEYKDWSERDESLASFIAQLAGIYLNELTENSIKKKLTKIRDHRDYFLNNTNTGIARLESKAPFSTLTEIDEQIEEILEQTFVAEFNLAFADLYDDIQHDLTHTPLSQLLDKENADETIKSFITEEYNLSEVESSLQLPNGDKLFFTREIIGNIQDNHFAGLWLVVKDITLYKRKALFDAELINNSNTLYTVIDTDNLVMFDNRAVEGLLGFLADERIGQNILSYIHKDDYEKVEEAIKKTIEHDTIESFLSIKLRSKTGDLFVTDCVITNELQNQNIKGIILEFNDLSEHNKVQDELLSKKHFFRALVENSSEVFTVVDQSGIIKYESPAMQKAFGHEPDVRIGRYGFECIHTYDSGKVQELFNKALNNPEQVYETPIRFLDAFNDWHELFLTIHNLSANEHIEGIVLKFEKDKPVSTQPISDQDKLSEAILKNATRVYLMTDAYGKITFVNKALKQQFGYKEEEVIGKNILEFVPREKRPSIKANLQFLESDIHANINLELDIKNARNEWTKAFAKANSLVHENRFEGILLQLEDVTDKVKQQSETGFRARFYGALVNNFSHVILFVGSNAKIKYVNTVGKQVLGYQLQGILTERLHSEDHDILLSNLKELEENIEKINMFKARLIDKEGEWKEFNFIASNAQKNSSFKGMILEVFEN